LATLIGSKREDHFFPDPGIVFTEFDSTFFKAKPTNLIEKIRYKVGLSYYKNRCFFAANAFPELMINKRFSRNELDYNPGLGIGLELKLPYVECIFININIALSYERVFREGSL
jgi:hypothetical protein